jgi:quercetin dioxygenase-like cupin family protein
MDDLTMLDAGAGERHAVAGADWTWKVRAEQTDGAFCFFEMTLAPGQGVPAHIHSYSEAFYIVEGRVQFAASAAGETPKTCSRGDVVLARPGVRHAFFNPGPDAARLLSISSAEHSRFFDAVVEADKSHAFSAMPAPDAFARVAEIGARTGTLFVAEPEAAHNSQDRA